MKRILITGAAGLVGGVLREHLRSDYRLVLLDRVDIPDLAVGETGVKGDIRDPAVLAMAMAGVDAVVHLAGELVAQRWSDKKRAEIEKSRVDSTRVLVEAMGAAKHKPSVFVCASATGYYGPRPRRRCARAALRSGSACASP